MLLFHFFLYVYQTGSPTYPWNATRLHGAGWLPAILLSAFAQDLWEDDLVAWSSEERHGAPTLSRSDGVHRTPKTMEFIYGLYETCK